MSSPPYETLPEKASLINEDPLAAPRRNPLKFAAGLLLSLALLSHFLLPTLSPSWSSSPDFSHLHAHQQCPGLEPISVAEFGARRTALASLLRGDDGTSWGAYVAEPGPNTLYYANLTPSAWPLSERPFLLVLTPSSASSHLSLLVPSFELSRAQLLPLALAPTEAVSWVTWEESESPYEVLAAHLEELRKKDGGGEGGVQVEENVRTFVGAGMGEVGRVEMVGMRVREQRMRKSEMELRVQRCVAKVTVAALREVRLHLRIGMTEKEGEKLIVDALTAAGLQEIGVIVLFGENAALPHASASSTKRLGHGEFALFDVDGSFHGYMSDFTRTMLPNVAAGCGRISQSWPNARAEKIWKTVHRAQEAGLASLVEQNSSSIIWAADVDKAAREVIASEGWGEFFSHRLGHGIGIQVHEHPYLNSGNRQPLKEGETFSVEPGVYIEQAVDKEGSGIGVRLEDMVHKTAEGWELLSGGTLASSPWNP